jgi:aconitate decarboxylase
VEGWQTVTESAGHYTSTLASYIADARKRELPPDLTEHVKLVVLDALGCGILGASAPWSKVIAKTLRATEQPGRSALWGSADRFSAANAAMFNGAAVHGYELDDIGPGSHYGSVTIPVALALAQEGAGLSGTELLNSFVTGVEVASRIAEGTGRIPHETCGFHGPGLFGAFAAMATASHVLGLDAQQSASAIGNVSQFTGGIMATQHGGMGKRLLAGKAAHSGTLAALLAANGFTNAPTIFECGYGSFPSAFSGGREEFDLEKMIAGLGQEYISYQIRFKFFAARGPIHPSLEILQALRRERGLTAAEVERIDIGLPDGSFKAVGFPYLPSSITSAQMNLQFCVATMLLEGDVFVEQFTEARIADPEVLDLIARIDVRHDQALDAGAKNSKPRDTIMAITLRTGEVIKRRQDRYLVGFGEDPELAARVAAKFRRTTAGRLTPAEQDRLVELCMALDTMADVVPIIELLGSSSTESR